MPRYAAPLRTNSLCFMICSNHLHELQWSWDGSRRSIEAFKSPVTTCAHYIVSFVSIGGGGLVLHRFREPLHPIWSRCSLGGGTCTCEIVADVRCDERETKPQQHADDSTCTLLFASFDAGEMPVQCRCSTAAAVPAPALHNMGITYTVTTEV